MQSRVHLDGSVLRNAYFRMFDAVPDAFVIADTGGTVRFVNAMTERMFGHERAVLIGAPIEMLVPERLRRARSSKRRRAAFPRVQRTATGLELVGLHRDGREFPLEVSFSPLQTEAGPHILTALRDISARKRAELDAHLLAAIVDSSQDAIIGTSAELTIRSWNRGATRIFGHSANEVLGQPLMILAPTREVEHEIHGQHERLWRGEPIAPWEGVRAHKDGSTVLVSLRLSAIRAPRGEVLGASVTARDLTAQRRAEEDTRRVHAHLVSSVESFQGMLALFDADDRMVLSNCDFAESLAGSEPASLRGRNFGELIMSAVREQRLQGDEPAGALITHLTQLHRACRGSLDLRTRDLRTVRIAIQATPVGDRVVTLRDVSDQMRRADELRAARLRAEDANAAKSDFLSSMSHELRTPLNAILGFSELLQRDKRAPLDPRQREKVAHIIRSGEHLTHLIDDVLDLVRLEAGRVTFTPEPVRVVDVFAEVRAALAPMAATAGVRFAADSAANEDIHVRADRTRLLQVLSNYGSNAIKYGKPGGSLHFAVEPSSEADARISVVDDGPGIDPAMHGKLFEPFQRAGQELGTVAGTGIGLLLCKRLAALMGGSVGFHSELGLGSRFWIELPVQDRAPRISLLPPDPTGSELSDPARRKILYIDDDPASVALMRAVFNDVIRMRLLTAPNAWAGSELARTQLPDVILVDIDLPTSRTLEATRALRSWPETRHIPLIALTASQLRREHQRIALFDHYLSKPVDIEELSRTLAQLTTPRS